MTFLAVLFGLAAMVWMIPIVQSGRMTPLATTVLIVGTVFGPAFFALNGPIQFSADRILWVAMFGILAIRWRMGLLTLSKPSRVDWMLIALTGWLLVSAVTGGGAPAGSSPTARWIFYIAMPVGMYMISRFVQLHQRDVRWFMNAMVALGVYLAVTAVCEVTGLHSLVFPKFIVSAETWEFYGRGRGPLLNPAGNGIVMSIALVASVLGFFRSDRQGKLLYAIATVVIMGGVYATLTRSAWLGAAATIGIIAMVHAPRWVRVLGVATAILFGGAMAMGLKDQLLRLKRDKHLTAADAEKSVQLRPLLAIVGYEMFKDKPLVGHGFGHYFEHSPPYHEIRSYGLPLETARPYAQHNIFLSILVDSGLIGLTLFVGVLVNLAGVAWQLARSPGCNDQRGVGLMMLGGLIAYFCNGMFQDVLIIPMVHMFLFFLGGIAMTVYARGLATGDLNVPDRQLTPAPLPAT